MPVPGFPGQQSSAKNIPRICWSEACETVSSASRRSPTFAMFVAVTPNAESRFGALGQFSDYFPWRLECRPCPPASQQAGKASLVFPLAYKLGILCQRCLCLGTQAYFLLRSRDSQQQNAHLGLLLRACSATFQCLLHCGQGAITLARLPTVILQWPTMLLRVALARTEFGAPVVRPLQNPFCLRGISPEWNSWCQLAPSLLRSAVAKASPVVLDNPTNRRWNRGRLLGPPASSTNAPLPTHRKNRRLRPTVRRYSLPRLCVVVPGFD